MALKPALCGLQTFEGSFCPVRSALRPPEEYEVKQNEASVEKKKEAARIAEWKDSILRKGNLSYFWLKSSNV